MIYLDRVYSFFSFEYDFATYALIASILIGVVCGVVGTLLVLKRLSLLGDATGHATLPGVCLGFMAAGGMKSIGPIFVGAIVSGFLAAYFIGVISRGRRVRSDAAIGIVLTSFFGFGVVLLSYLQSSPTGEQSGLNAFLFGNVAGITQARLLWIGAMAVGILAVVIGFYRWLAVATFDENFAATMGIPVVWVHNGLLALLSTAVVLSIESVGVVLVSAMLIIPASTALLFSKELKYAMFFSAGFGAFDGVGGALLSYLFEGVSTGPAMAIVSGCVFLFVLLARRAKVVVFPVLGAGHNV